MDYTSAVIYAFNKIVPPLISWDEFYERMKVGYYINNYTIVEGSKSKAVKHCLINPKTKQEILNLIKFTCKHYCIYETYGLYGSFKVKKRQKPIKLAKDDIAILREHDYYMSPVEDPNVPEHELWILTDGMQTHYTPLVSSYDED